MRILLINSPYRFPDQQVHRTELLGLEYLGASIRAAGHDLLIYDPTLHSCGLPDGDGYYYGEPDETIRKKFSDFAPDCVGISCHYSFAINNSFRVARIAKDINPQAVVVLGGLYVSIFKERVLEECEAVDYCLIGESESSFIELLSHISSKSALGSIDGLIYRQTGKVVLNKKTKFITELDSLPFPARDAVDISAYMNGSSVKHLYGLGSKSSLSLLTSRSCPNKCSYCNMWLIHGSRWRPRTPDNVIGEIDEIVCKYKAKHIFFMDDNFTFNIARAKTICEKIISRGYEVRWNTPNGISVKKMDIELAFLMKRSGCANVCIAIESGSEYMRKEVMNKNVTNEEIRRAVNCFKKAGIPVVGFIIVGMPEEDKTHFNETVRFIKDLPLASLVVSFAMPFPGTRLYENLIASGVINSGFNIERSDLNAPAFSTALFSKEELVLRKKTLKDLLPGLGILFELEEKYN